MTSVHHSLIGALAAAIAVTAAPAALAETPSASLRAAQSTVDLRVCNYSGRNATVAVSYVQPGESQFINRGWYDVANGSCRELVSTDNANFYFYADATDGSGRRWQGNHTLCVQYPGPYTFYTNRGQTECEYDQETRGFTPFTAEDFGSWTWTLDP